MVTCPACGKENEDSALECKRCRAPLREEEHDQAGAFEPVGEVCQHCEAFNEPGVAVCTNCGQELAGAPPAGEPAADNPSMSQELRALALSDEEAAEAGFSGGNGHAALDKTPPHPFSPPPVEAQRPTSSRARVVEMAGAVLGGAAAVSVDRQRPPGPPVLQPQAAPAPVEKACGNCGAFNPAVAKFCFDCGTPFFKKPAPKTEPPPSIQVDESMQTDLDVDVVASDSGPESAAVTLDDVIPADAVGEPIPEEPPALPFTATVVVEKGNAQGSAFTLVQLETTLGATGTAIELGEDVFVAPQVATLSFVEDRLVLRDEGSVNGVFVKVRESVALDPGDLFVAGEHLLRYEGPVELSRGGEGDTPLLGAPRPQGAAYRIVEVLAGGRTGRTCHRSAPVIALGRSGCDLNFSDPQLGARHAEIRVAEDGSVSLVDLGQGPAGLFVRVRPQQQFDLSGGEILMVGDQLLRVEM